ncbi:unnamed protein product [Angiostrongylus costaricensis]|uniref:Peptidase_S9 domain-containing protein n=1 Tax=Angiostrongylus costaricensis TaxID=334426 RepID=A0A158PEI7_ANGCS|nr:unnamed protein product [Angiostrongylus costaricensis]
MSFSLRIIPLASSATIIIPRELLFSDSKYSMLSLSPNGSPVGFDKSNLNMYWLWSDQFNDPVFVIQILLIKLHYLENSDGKWKSLAGSFAKFPFDAPEKKELLYTATRAEISGNLFHPTDITLLTITEVTIDFCHFALTSLIVPTYMSIWLVTYSSSDKPYEIFIYRRWLKEAEFLFNSRPELEAYKLNNQISFDFKTRDNMVLQAYLSLPPEVNFRGTSGFGKRLTNAGDDKWSKKMHLDILDSVDFAVAKGITNKSLVAIIGGSYGGYEALVALTFTPDAFCCGEDIVGPSNLMTLIQTVPPHCKGIHAELVRMLGGDSDTYLHIFTRRRTSNARCSLTAFFANRVEKPLVILQGTNDPRVKQRESGMFIKEYDVY